MSQARYPQRHHEHWAERQAREDLRQPWWAWLLFATTLLATLATSAIWPWLAATPGVQ